MSVDYETLIRPRLASILAPEEVRRWFDPLQWVHEPLPNRLRLICPTVFHQKKLAGYSPLILDMAGKAGRPLAGLSLESHPRSDQPPVHLELEGRPAPAPEHFFDPLDGAHSFERFIRGPGNQLAALALSNFTADPGSLGSGSLLLTAAGPWGKTHLLDALTLSLSRGGRGGLMKISTAPEAPRPPARAWAEAEVIIVDDIHRLEDRPELQRPLIQAFDRAGSGRLTVICGAPAPPQRLGGLSEALRSRLGGGLVLTISAPEYELLLELARRRAYELNLAAAPDLLALLAREARQDPRRLMGFLDTLAFVARRAELPLDQALAFLDLDRRSGPLADQPPVDMEGILRAVSEAFGLKMTDLTGHSRLRQAAWPRRVAMLLARELTGLTTTEIGEAFDGRDHSTVIHALKKVRQEMRNPSHIQMVENIKRSLLTARKNQT